MKESKERTVAELAEVVKGRVYGNPETVIRGIASIEEARFWRYHLCGKLTIPAKPQGNRPPQQLSLLKVRLALDSWLLVWRRPTFTQTR